jgi:glucose-6-phosphate isomerase
MVIFYIILNDISRFEIKYNLVYNKSMININLSYTNTKVSPTTESELLKANASLNDHSGLGSDFLGWSDVHISAKEVEDILLSAKRLQKLAKIMVVVGIGGSYLGTRAVIEAINGLFPKGQYKVIYLGNTISSEYTYQVLEYLKDKDFVVNCISKSGTTTEPAVAFRLLLELLKKQKGKQYAQYVVATTDPTKGALLTLAKKEGYQIYQIPENIGGRYSVLTAVGLLPIAYAEVDIKKLLEGARAGVKDFNVEDVKTNPAFIYAGLRYELAKKYKAEVLVSYHLQLQQLGEWWKQLYGESEGKLGKGLFPASMTFSTDLHSLGQFVQEGTKMLFETVLKFETAHDISIPETTDNLDGLNYLVGKKLSYVNEQAMYGTIQAHYSVGGVENIVIECNKLDEYNLGYLLFFFMKACALSGYLLKVNPFDQPGVEVYKKKMFKLLGKE